MAPIRKINVQSIVHDHYESNNTVLMTMGTHDGGVFLYNGNKRMKTYQFHSKIHSITLEQLNMIVGTRDTLHYTTLFGDVTWEHKLENEMIHRLDRQQEMIISCGYQNLLLLDQNKELIWKSDSGKEWRDCKLVDNLMYTANEHYIKLWDIRNLKSEISVVEDRYSVAKHTKPISQLSITNKYVISGGLDQSLRWFNKDLLLEHSVKTTSPILNLSADSDNKWVSVGLVNGMIRKYTKCKEHKEPKSIDLQTPSTLIDPNVTIYKPAPYNKSKPYEVALRKFRYADAIDLALNLESKEFWDVMLKIDLQDGLQQGLRIRSMNSIKPILEKCRSALVKSICDESLVLKCITMLTTFFPPHECDSIVRDNYARIMNRLKQLKSARKQAFILKAQIEFIMT